MKTRNQKISEQVRALLVWQCNIRDGFDKLALLPQNDPGRALIGKSIDQCIEWFDDSGRELIKLGIDVTLYNPRGVK